MGLGTSSSSRAVLSLALGIFSLAFGFILGIPAIVLGALARREVTASDGALTGAGMASAALVLGAVGTVIGIAWTVALLGGAIDVGFAG